MTRAYLEVLGVFWVGLWSWVVYLEVFGEKNTPSFCDFGKW